VDALTTVVTPGDSGKEPVIIKGRVLPPPTIIHDQSAINTGPPRAKNENEGGLLVPVDDFDEDLGDETTIAVRKEYYGVEGGEGQDDPTLEGPWDGAQNGLAVEYFPDIDSFVPVEKMPQAIDLVEPEYPRLAKLAGIEGEVIIKALIDSLGHVRKAVAYRSSGTAVLDDAAIAAAYKSTFTPGIQNKRPVSVWVSYEVEFRLDR
jgi:TonB family protein